MRSDFYWCNVSVESFLKCKKNKDLFRGEGVRMDRGGGEGVERGREG